jgi:protein-tyrosine phosphatase
MIKVLMICMGNICRSPLAHGVFEHIVKEAGLADKISVDSAGTHFYHVGCLPDDRSILKAREYGIDITTQRARQLTREDFTDFDYLLVMDKRNLRDASVLAPTPEHAQKLTLFLDYSLGDFSEIEVPDPYYGGVDGFEHVYHLVQVASMGFLQHLKAKEPALC